MKGADYMLQSNSSLEQWPGTLLGNHKSMIPASKFTVQNSFKIQCSKVQNSLDSLVPSRKIVQSCRIVQNCIEMHMFTTP